MAYIEQDKYVQTIDSYDYIPDEPLPRASINIVSNAQGMQLLDLCKSTSVNIIYGRLDEGQSKKISNDQELIQSDPTSCPQNQKGNN